LTWWVGRGRDACENSAKFGRVAYLNNQRS
jgi:hypothetical protein